MSQEAGALSQGLGSQDSKLGFTESPQPFSKNNESKSPELQCHL